MDRALRRHCRLASPDGGIERFNAVAGANPGLVTLGLTWTFF